jgi:signal transduction histidine kinase
MSAVRNERGEILFVSCIMRDITERKQAEEALRVYAARMQDLSKRLMESEETERRNIGRELHDSIGQNLSALSLQLGSIRAYQAKGLPQAAGARLDDAQKLLEATTRQVRNIMAELRPAELDDFGLMAALRSYCADYAKRFDLFVAVTGEDIVPRLVPATEMALFRIAQEALNNVIKHAHAARVEVSLVITPECVTLIVTDDGVGFDLTPRSTAGFSLGIILMKERAEAVGATMRVESAPGQGARVVVEAARART